MGLIEKSVPNVARGFLNVIPQSAKTASIDMKPKGTLVLKGGPTYVI